MTDEEKNVINYLQKDIINYYYSQKPNFDTLYLEDIYCLETIVEIIKNQQKEIEQKNVIIFAGAEKVKVLEKEIEKYKALYEKALNDVVKQSKEIEELKIINNMQKYRIEVIDERELIPKSKIEKKIKQYSTSNLTINICGRGNGRTFQQAVRNEVEKVLKELL